LRDCCCKKPTESQTQITRGYLKVVARSACRDPFGSLEFTSEISEGIEPLKCSKGYGGRNRLTEVKFRREDATSFGKKSLWNRKRMVELLQGEVSEFHGPLDLIDQQRD
jgi:hypothetical protein